MTQDALTVLNDIPFSIPPYFALLARAIVTLEGVALTGNPNYGIIMESYPFVARKLLKEDRPEIQKALQQVLYAPGGGADGGGGALRGTRLSVLLNSALGIVAKTSGAFVDLDSVPADGVSTIASVKFLLSDKARSLRALLVDEAALAGDVLLRQVLLFRT
jgi:aarF domain-containing kinase